MGKLLNLARWGDCDRLPKMDFSLYFYALRGESRDGTVYWQPAAALRCVSPYWSGGSVRRIWGVKFAARADAVAYAREHYKQGMQVNIHIETEEDDD